ncbi:MAG TPA: DUF86 domain-containing protein [Rubrobacteraceae bacterium]|nr:DUF86 domain-containing protein [Rubrobacteraceae bacterium]
MSNDRVFLLHIRDALREVLTFIEGESYESFLANRMVQNAVMRSFEVVGEAARRVSPEFRQTHPEVPWRLMSDFRNKLIHDYFGLDLEVIWKTATEDAPVLLAQVEGLIEA